ncbi:MAG: SDR family oxidoreductase [Aggregatilineales bacterium]
MAYTIDLSGRVAVVTGGSGYLGTALCRGLLQAGAAVVIADRNAQKAKRSAEALAALGGQAVGLHIDVLDTNTIAETARTVLSTFGRVDALVNCAGGNNPSATTGPDQSFFDLPREALERVIDLNLMGTLLPSQIFGKVMAQQGQGVILNIASMSALRPLTRVAAYSAAKAATVNFTQWLAVYMAREHSAAIRVNAIAPGFFLTDQNRYLLSNADGSLTTRGQQIINHTPMGRFGLPEDLIGAALWLVSDAARFVTGIVVPVDGGFSAYGGV